MVVGLGEPRTDRVFHALHGRDPRRSRSRSQLVSLTNISKDREALTMTITTEFDVPVERVWQLWADARQLEKVWGPPTYPATVVDHDLTPGGRVTYYMTSPEGTKHAGYWQVTAVDEPWGFTFEGGIADLDFTPSPGLPVSTNDYRFVAHAGGTRATYLSTFTSAESLQQALDMGMAEGASGAIDQ